MSSHLSLRVARSRTGRAVALLTGLAVTLGMSLGSAVPAHAAGDVLRTPLERASGEAFLLAYWGTGAAAWADRDYGVYTSTGGTWQRSSYEEGANPDTVADGKLVTSDTHEVRVLDLVSGAVARYPVPDAEVVIANPDTAVGWLEQDDEWAQVSFDLDDPSSYRGLTFPEPDEPAGTKSLSETYTLTQTALVTGLNYLGKKDVPLGAELIVQPLDGSAAWSLPVEGSLPWVGGDSEVAYLHLDDSTLRYCEVALGGGQSSCVLVSDEVADEVTATRFDDGSLGLTIDGAPFLWESDELTEVSVPDDAGLSFPIVGGGNARPLAAVTDADGATSFFRVQPNGSLAAAAQPSFTSPWIPESMDLGSGWVAGLDAAGASRAWVRERKADGSLGDPVILSETATGIDTSAGRTILNDERGVVRYDRGVAQKPTAAVYQVEDLSGPYALVQPKQKRQFELRSPTATLATKLTNVSGLFGSLVATVNTKKQTVTVTDAVSRKALTRAFGPMDGILAVGDMWGDWVGLTFLTESDEEDPVYSYYTVILNYRDPNLPLVQFEGLLYSLGDGFAHGTRDGVDYLWNYRTEQETALDDVSFTWSTFSDDTLAYATAEDLVLRTVGGAGGSAPRALGILADPGCNAFDCDWKLDVDATTALAAGNLVLTGTGTAAGASVTLPVGAARDGSLRLAWDGRLADDSFAPAGSYTWSLDVGDGGQRLRTVDGVSEVTGTLKVTRDKLPMPAYVPTITGRAATGQPLTADPGDYPAGAVVKFQWYRGTKAIKGAAAQAATYLVTAADVGKALKVKVSYSGMEVYKDTTATSKATAKGAKGIVSPGALAVTGTPRVDSTLTATPSGHNPTPGWKYQWYRVSAKGKATKIKKATKAAYPVTSADAGLRLKVTATGTLAGYTTVAESVTTSDVVSPGEWTAPTPVIEGTAGVGQTLRTQVGVYHGSQGQVVVPKFTYQWLRDDGANPPVAIKGATKATYRPTAADAGQHLIVRVTATRAGYPTLATPSVAVGPVAP